MVSTKIFLLLQVKDFAVFIFSLKNAFETITNEIEFNHKIGAKTRVQAYQV